MRKLISLIVYKEDFSERNKIHFNDIFVSRELIL